MVSRIVRRILIAAVLVWLPFSHLQAKELSDYRVGDTVDADIVAPEKFLLVNEQGTDALRQRETARMPMVARYYPGAADEAEVALRKSFTDARNNFLNLVETQFHRQLPDKNVTDDFLQQVISYPGQDKSFPLNLTLAGLWARGESDEAFLNGLTSRLHDAMKQYILPAQVPDGWKTGSGARLIALTNADIIPTPQMVEEKGFTVTRSNIVSFTRVRTDFRATFDEEDHAWANYAVEFLKENCAPDVKLTEAVRAYRTAAIQMGDTYQAGQVVVKRGAVVTAKNLAAIQKVSELSAPKVAPVVQKPVAAPVAPTAPPVAAPAVAVPSNNNGPLWFALGAVSLLSVIALWLLLGVRRRPAVSLLPAQMDMEAGGLSSTPAGGRDLRDIVAPHLARLLTNKLVRKLIAQRADLMLMQQQVAMEIAELEKRLEQVHAPLQERLSAYEKRIHELEAQLAVQTEQNKELIKAKIEGVKQQMENARAKNRLKFN